MVFVFTPKEHVNLNIHLPTRELLPIVIFSIKLSSCLKIFHLSLVPWKGFCKLSLHLQLYVILCDHYFSRVHYWLLITHYNICKLVRVHDIFSSFTSWGYQVLPVCLSWRHIVYVRLVIAPKVFLNLCFLMSIKYAWFTVTL